MIITRKQLPAALVGLLLTCAAALSPLVATPTWLAVAITITFVIFFGWLSGRLCIRDKTAGEHLFFGTLLLLSSFICVLSIVYWFFAMTALIVAISTALFGVGLTILSAAKKVLPSKIPRPHLHKARFSRATLLPITITAFDLILIGKLTTLRLGDTLGSPWTIIGPKFFLLFFLTTILLLYTLRKKIYSHGTRLSLLALHYILLLGVALIVFKHGFGFDPFIHRASEQWILDHAAITPKVPYYIGQYVLVVAAKLMSHAPLFWIDQILVPLGAALTLTFGLYYTLRDRIRDTELFPAILLTALIPLSFFINTAPHNLALLMALASWLFVWRTVAPRDWLALIPSAASAAIHPFVGIPLSIAVLGLIILRRWQKKYRSIRAAVLILSATILPLIFISYGAATLNTTADVRAFLSLFQYPHYYRFALGSQFAQVLYTITPYIAPALLLVGGIGLYQQRRTMQAIAWITITATVGTSIAAYVLATMLQFQDVIFYERSVYADRLLDFAFILLLPWITIGIAFILSQLSKAKRRDYIILPVAALLLLGSWYITYPTRDSVSRYTGQSVRDADIAAVEFIASRHDDTDYVVLSNQMIGAAALQVHSFAQYHDVDDGTLQYFYSIPTGGPLYQYFRKMVYQEPQRQWMEEAMDFANVDTAYFVHTNYWYPAAEIRDAAKKDADNWWDIGNGRVWVYEYHRSTDH